VRPFTVATFRYSWDHARGGPSVEVREGENTHEGGDVTPTQRTLKLLRAAGYTAAVVERFNQFAGVRQDLFGFGDLIAARANPKDIVLVQATSTPNMAARVKKIRALPAHTEWLGAGGRILVIGWSKKRQNGKRQVWVPRIVELTADKESEVAA